MGTTDAVLMTGVTGTLGSWMAAKALEDGRGVCAVARTGRDGATPRQRVESSLAACGAVPLDRLQIIEGDITDDNAWLNDGLSFPSDVGSIIHCAACTEFGDAAAAASHAANVGGVRRVLALAARRRLPVVHVSTAYVAGQRHGVVYERELDEGQCFNNVYERTKCAGEALVRDWSRQTGLPATILRPGIVVGDYDHGRTLRFNTLYDIMQVLDSIGAASAATRAEEVRIAGDPRVTKNVIPIDYFAAAAWHVIRSAPSGTYHITHPRPLTLADLQRIFAEIFDVRATLVSEAEFRSRRPSRAERLCHRATQSYRPYISRVEPVFDRRALDAALAGSGIAAPALDANYFRRLLGYARQVNWGRCRAGEVRGNGKMMAPVAEYFDGFLASRVGRNLLPDVRRLSARIAVAFAGADAHWSLHVQDGTLRAISNNGMATDCRYVLDVPTFIEIVGGRLSPQQAFFARRVEIAGDVETGLRVAAVLGQFFRRHPFQPGQA